MPGMVMAVGLRDVDPRGCVRCRGEDPLELLMRLRPVTAARYAGEETVREARCRKIAVTVSGTTAVFIGLGRRRTCPADPGGRHQRRRNGVSSPWWPRPQ